MTLINPVGTPTDPDFETQTPTNYKINIDNSIVVGKRLGQWFACHESEELSPPAPMTVVIEGGFIWDGGSLLEVGIQVTGVITAPSGNPRIDRVVLDKITGVVSVVEGTENESPVAPAIPEGKIPCAQILLDNSPATTTITNQEISDERTLLTTIPIPAPVDVIPIGAVIDWFGLSSDAPSLWLVCDGANISSITFEDLAAILIKAATQFGVGSGVTFTTDFGTDEKLDAASHGLSNDTLLHVTSTGALPAGLSIDTPYYVINTDTNDFEVSLTKGGSAVDITSDEGGNTHSFHTNINLPDLRGRVTIGLDDMGTGAANVVTNVQADLIGGIEGLKDHQLTIPEMPSHTHTSHNTANLSGTATPAHLSGSNDSTGATGGDGFHNNMQPYMAIHKLIKS